MFSRTSSPYRQYCRLQVLPCLTRRYRVTTACSHIAVPSIAAGASSARQVVACAAKASEGESRVVFLKKAGLATAAVIAAAPTVVLAEEDGEERKVGDEVTTDSGLHFVVTAVGKGAKPSPGNTIKAHYTGELG